MGGRGGTAAWGTGGGCADGGCGWSPSGGGWPPSGGGWFPSGGGVAPGRLGGMGGGVIPSVTSSPYIPAGGAAGGGVGGVWGSGGGAANSGARAGTVLAGAQAAMPAVHTMSVGFI